MADVHTLEICSRQHTKRLNAPLLREMAARVIDDDLRVRDYEICFHFVDAAEMARVNEQFLRHAGSTDVITFDYAEPQHAQSGLLRGEIFISIPDAVAQAKEFGTTWQSEVIRYMIHGLLHLRGYDDLEPSARRIMKREENRLVKKITATFALAQIGASRPAR